jgi:hypothetical protein
VYPIFYVLMSAKTETIYKEIFLYIEKNITTLNPVSFVTDFELALRKAIRYVYPAVTLTSCWFHFCQCLRRKASGIENFLKTIYVTVEAYKLYFKFMALPLLPPHMIENSFNELKSYAYAQFGDLFGSFLSYFEHQWIIKVQKKNQNYSCI